MSDPHRLYRIRCPVHGFIVINDWERAIVDQPAFQRLRRIRQLAWTDQVYPGAMHTRFEHSLGVLHVADQLYEATLTSSRDLLRSELSYNDEGLRRDRALVRLAALLHDVGHAPFSHASERLFPARGDSSAGGKEDRYRHENYSAAMIRTHLRDCIEDHPLNQNHGITAEMVADLLEGNTRAGRSLFWRELVSGQLDSDRIDYLIRDSLHAGVEYGRFDWRRLVDSVRMVRGPEDSGPRLGVGEGGFHAAEGLILARYFMFTQVYFHKTRVACNIHLENALAEMLPGGAFPPPEGPGLDAFLRWDDWRVLGLLAAGEGGEHGRRLAGRDHYRQAYHTPESPTPKDLLKLDRVRSKLGCLLRAEASSGASGYKMGESDIPVAGDNPAGEVRPLSSYSPMVRGLAPLRKSMLYCRKEDMAEARGIIESLENRWSRR